MTNLPLKYIGYTIVFQEVPNEITLAINISGCPYKCKGCHSKYLWEYKGNYISEDLDLLIDKYKEHITCVCFMGGDQNLDELNQLISKVHNRGYKCCLYTGSNNFPEGLTEEIDYIKLGKYVENLGGLNTTTTNQSMWKRTDNGFINITNLFQQKKI